MRKSSGVTGASFAPLSGAAWTHAQSVDLFVLEGATEFYWVPVEQEESEWVATELSSADEGRSDESDLDEESE